MLAACMATVLPVSGKQTEVQTPISVNAGLETSLSAGPEAGEESVQSPYTIAQEGAWCWFADPRALHYRDASGKTDRTYVGYIDAHGAIRAMQYDFLNHRKDEVLIRSYFQPDDHDNPTFLALPDGRIIVFYSRHTDEACFYYRISRLPGDITTLGKEHRLATKHNTTYPSPFILSDDPQHIYLCWRGINWHPTIGKLSLPDEQDEVRFVEEPRQIVQSTGARPYAKYYSNGKDRIFLTYTTGHPDNELPNHLYFNYIRIPSMQLTDVNGRVISDISAGPFRVSKREEYAAQYPATLVDRTDLRAWVWQVCADSLGRPCIAMVRISPDKKQHDYYYAFWTGSEWKKIFLTHAGGHFHQTPNIEHCYSGGMTLDPADPRQVYCSVPVEGRHGKVYEILKYTVDPEQGTVSAPQAMTRNSEKNNSRPYLIPGSEKSPLRLAWMYGDYYDWIVSKSRPKGYATGIRCDFDFPAQSSAVNLKKGLAHRGTKADLAKKKKLKLPKNSAFTLSFIVNLPDSFQTSTFCFIGDVAYAVQGKDLRPAIYTPQRTYPSTNILGSADSWQLYGRGTNGKWYKPAPLRDCRITLTYDKNTLRTYVNGVLDQSVEMPGLQTSDLRIGSELYLHADRYILYKRALNQEEIKQLDGLSF